VPCYLITYFLTDDGLLYFRQQTESTTIDNTAKEALNTSNEAYRIAQEATQKPGELSSEVEIIHRR